MNPTCPSEKEAAAESLGSCFCQRLTEYSDVPLRLALAATFLAHGYQKIFIWGVDNFANHMHLPGLLAWVAALAEFGGAIALILGLFTRVAALGHAVIMIVAIATVHYSQGFMMSEGKGFEWQFALLCMAISLMLRGAGPLSVDHLLRRYGIYDIAVGKKDRCCCKK